MTSSESRKSKKDSDLEKLVDELFEFIVVEIEKGRGENEVVGKVIDKFGFSQREAKKYFKIAKEKVERSSQEQNRVLNEKESLRRIRDNVERDLDKIEDDEEVIDDLEFEGSSEWSESEYSQEGDVRTLGRVIGYIIFYGAGIVLFLFWLMVMVSWFGILGGIILSFVLSPGLIIFPIVFWLVEGVFPVLYFMLWGVSIVGLIIAKTSED